MTKVMRMGTMQRVRRGVAHMVKAVWRDRVFFLSCC
jgi:hypothetical protein